MNGRDKPNRSPADLAVPPPPVLLMLCLISTVWGCCDDGVGEEEAEADRTLLDPEEGRFLRCGGLGVTLCLLLSDSSNVLLIGVVMAVSNVSAGETSWGAVRCDVLEDEEV